MKGIGLVFAGGGGKGAYEIGVWKYLHEIGLDQYVRAVSGTSVGALNAALFAGSTYEIAEDLWLNIEPRKILSPKEIKPEEVMKFLAISGLSSTGPIGKVFGKVSSVAISKTAMGAETIAGMLLMKIRSDYLFSRTGLIELIQDGVNFPMLQNSSIPCYATCLKCPLLQIERFELNNFSAENITKILLASSAIPVVFANEEFQGEKYCDGGIPVVGDNVPITPVYDTGVEHIIVVHLGQDVCITKDQFPHSKIIEIIPSIDLGNALTGTLDFTPDGASKRIELGYQDTQKILKPMVEMLIQNVKSQMMLKTVQKRMIEFEQKKAILIEDESIIKKEMESDGFDELLNELMKEK